MTAAHGALVPNSSAGDATNASTPTLCLGDLYQLAAASDEEDADIQTGGLFFVGIAISLVSSASTNLGANVQRLALSREQLRPAHLQRPMYCIPLWVAGFAGFISSQGGDALALLFAPQSVVQPVGSLSLIANMFFAWWLNSEPIGRHTPVAVIVIIVGVVSIVTLGPKTTANWSAERIATRWTEPNVVAYACVGVGVTVTLVLWLLHYDRKISLHARQLCLAAEESERWRMGISSSATAGGASGGGAGVGADGSGEDGGAGAYAKGRWRVSGAVGMADAMAMASGRDGTDGHEYAPSAALPCGARHPAACSEPRPAAGGLSGGTLSDGSRAKATRGADGGGRSGADGGKAACTKAPAVRLAGTTGAKPDDGWRVPTPSGAWAPRAPRAIDCLPPHERRLITVLYPLTAAACAGWTPLLVKQTLLLMKAASQGEESNGRGQFVIVLGIAISGPLQLIWLARGLRNVEAQLIVPAFASLFTIFSILGGALFFEELSTFCVSRIPLFALSVALTTSGVALLYQRASEARSSRPPSAAVSTATTPQRVQQRVQQPVQQRGGTCPQWSTPRRPLIVEDGLGCGQPLPGTAVAVRAVASMAPDLAGDGDGKAGGASGKAGGASGKAGSATGKAGGASVKAASATGPALTAPGIEKVRSPSVPVENEPMRAAAGAPCLGPWVV